MTFDQKIQIWVAAGTWVAGLGSFAAAGVALYLSRRNEKLRLRVEAGLRLIDTPGHESLERCVGIQVTNLGDRPVTINSVGWAIGKGKHRQFAVQNVAGLFTHTCPAELAHGKTAMFLVSLTAVPNWARNIATKLVKDSPDKSLKSFVAWVHTSVGKTIEVRREDDLLNEIKAALQSEPSFSAEPTH